ncbi:MAG TPA: response regulator transcription factor [Nocardioides sp.]|uniref:response regulator transcription factor n=1 Tax=Nocardioides sp. TaxID=35761 RepID=UPI002C35E12C|nr:response regulator transcription factor [Nocardioides sp.]HQR26825.1 response regulator transcription factor [Nocardioides sp.]
MGKVLVVDDERRMLDMLSRFLAADGHEVLTAGDGVEALDSLAHDPDVDLMLLDLMMPRCNGLQVLSTLSAWEDPPQVIVLSAVNEVAARVDALDRGAADYVGKPFHAAELMARVRRHLVGDSARGAHPTGRYLAAGGVTLDLERRRAQVSGSEVALSERETGLLSHLMRRRGSVCRRDELLHDVWGLDFDPGSNVVDVCMRRLRTKIADLPIETVRGVGYCFDGV